ncbi:unannotated protein [freshwater metagenome]|uniref:Unannotated protein n=1 Tax=freshwater metagenome TaxID=449393 RepID=A0A6J5YLF4_9ZZZZ
MPDDPGDDGSGEENHDDAAAELVDEHRQLGPLLGFSESIRTERFASSRDLGAAQAHTGVDGLLRKYLNALERTPRHMRGVDFGSGTGRLSYWFLGHVHSGQVDATTRPARGCALTTGGLSHSQQSMTVVSRRNREMQSPFSR